MIERSPNNAREMHFFIYAGLFLLGATETCVSPCFPVVSLALNTVVKSDGGKIQTLVIWQIYSILHLETIVSRFKSQDKRAR